MTNFFHVTCYQNPRKEKPSNLKVLQIQTRNFIKKETLAQCFPVNFVKFLRTPFLQNTSERLSLGLLT